MTMKASPFLTLWGEDPGAGETSMPVAAGKRAAVEVPSERARREGHVWSLTGDEDDLTAQRWAVVAPAGDRGQHLVELVRPLCELRKKQQGDDVLVYRPREHATTADAESFLEQDYRTQARRRATATGNDANEWAVLPRYLLLLGDADGLSWSFQQTLARHGLFVGRLCFPDGAGYVAYVEKVLRAEGAVVPAREALFYAVTDGSSATASATKGLLAPMARQLESALRRGHYQAGPLSIHTIGLEQAPWEDDFRGMLARAAAATGGAMFSVSHGVGLGAGVSAEVRRARQGGLQLASNHALFLDGVAEKGPPGQGELRFEPRAALGEGIAKGPFLELGAWFFFACFSAGTPADSVYSEWLLSSGDEGRAKKALATLPSPGETAFVAALPQAALANPRGPLAVVGHVDLAWSWSYEAERPAPDGPRGVPRGERLSEVYKGLLQGDRFGVAHHALSTFGMSVGTSLLWLEEAERRSGKVAEDPVFEKASLWLEYQDLAGYVLLGDPAARLPAAVAEAPRSEAEPARASVPASAQAGAPPSAPAKVGTDSRVLRTERAVLECLSRPGDTTRLSEQASRLGVRAEELKALVDAYRDAGRRALASKLAGG